MSGSCKVPMALPAFAACLTAALPCCRTSTSSIFSTNRFPQSIALLFFLLYEVSPPAQTGPSATWGLRAPRQPCSPNPGTKVLPAPSVSLPSSHTPFVFYFTDHSSTLCQRRALSRTPCRQTLAMPGIFCCWHKEILHPVDIMWTHERLLHLSIVWLYTHMELNPHTCLLRSSVLSVFCHCHQELRVLNHLRAPGSIKDLFLMEFPLFILFPGRKHSLGCYPLLYSIPTGLSGTRENYKSNASE